MNNNNYFETITIRLFLPLPQAIAKFERLLTSSYFFSILSGNTNTDLSVDANGTIHTERALDYETTPSYVITVKSRDSSSPSSTQKSVTVEVTIDVTPVNEHAPVFTSLSYAYSVQEDTAIGTSLLRVTATDADDGPQGIILHFES